MFEKEGPSYYAHHPGNMGTEICSIMQKRLETMVLDRHHMLLLILGTGVTVGTTSQVITHRSQTQTV